MQKRVLYLGNVSSKIAFPILNTLSSVMLGLCNNFIKVFEYSIKKKKQKNMEHIVFCIFFICSQRKACPLLST